MILLDNKRFIISGSQTSWITRLSTGSSASSATRRARGKSPSSSSRPRTLLHSFCRLSAGEARSGRLMEIRASCNISLRMLSFLKSGPGVRKVKSQRHVIGTAGQPVTTTVVCTGPQAVIASFLIKKKKKKSPLIPALVLWKVNTGHATDL